MWPTFASQRRGGADRRGVSSPPEEGFRTRSQISTGMPLVYVQVCLYCRSRARIIYCSDNAKIRQSHFSPRFTLSGTSQWTRERGKDCGSTQLKHKNEKRRARDEESDWDVAVMLLASAFVVAQSQDTSS